MNSEITLALQESFKESFLSHRANRIAMDAVTSVGVNAAARNPEAFRTDLHQFSLKLDQGEITNQQRSGRCWMFASLNTMRFRIMKKLNLDTFELSENYTLFYDKLEKANYFLESILETMDEPTSSRLMSWLLSGPLSDGGQWDMICGLIDKYGVVPKAAYPETYNSASTGEMTSVMTEKLREFACILRKAKAEGADAAKLGEMKEEMMKTIYSILCTCLGVPPTKVDLEVRDKDGNFISDYGLTPQEFFKKYVDMDLKDFVSVINAPTSDKPYYHSYTIQYLGSVKEGRPIKHVNLPIEELKKAAIAQMQDGYPVWFGCDVGKSSVREQGLMSMSVYNKEDLLDTTFTMTKAERLDYGQSLMTHAMVFQGVNLDENGKPNRWRVENSWGKDAGKDGYYVMTDDWFDEYMYQIVVDIKYLSEEAKKAYAEDPIVLAPWDPMGSLA